MKRVYLIAAGAALFAACAWLAPKTIPTPGIVTIEAQSFPLTVKVGWDPDASGATMGYTVALDGGSAADIGLPATGSCVAFVGSASAPCVQTSVTITSGGSHTVSVIGYDLGGNSKASTVTFNVTPPASAPSNGRVLR